ncbi:MAG TPA: Spy/CpxP family protein refolding chaperone [Bradyrhizobium sp.]|nr:Spy/CpxP family protein refolding chaperone [Bradyrhizobium sp.]
MSKIKMPKLKWLSVMMLSIALSGAGYAAQRGGGGGHGGGGHGGGRGGGGAHVAGGGGHFAGARAGGFRGGSFHGGGARFAGGGRHFGGGSAISRAARTGHVGASRALAASHAGGNLSRHAAFQASAVHHALAGAAVAAALHNHNALHNPGTRAQIAAAAATAGLSDRRHGGWWRHGNGGYGWVGPLFWPFAYYDIYDYALWGYDPSFWDYGYGDIYAGIFAPYGYDDLAGYLPYGGGPAPSSVSGHPPNEPNALAQMCGEDTQDIAGLPIDRIQQALAPDDEQRKALDELANATVRAAQTIKAACPTQVASTASGRLAAMQSRLEAMISAVNIVQPPLDHFYGLLNDEQKSRLTALGVDQQRSRKNEGVLAQGCGNGQPSQTDWPAAEIEQRLHPTEAQRAGLNNLQDASAKAIDMLKGTCEPNDPLTPPARLAAAGKRLDAMLQAVETVKAALDDFYGELTDEQKAQFESIGPGRMSSMASGADDESAPRSRHYRRHYHHASIGGIVRRLIGF